MNQFGLGFLVIGLSMFVAGRFDLVEKGLKKPVLRWFVSQYKLIDLWGGSGAHRRYLQRVGLMLAVLGALVVVNSLLKQ